MANLCPLDFYILRVPTLPYTTVSKLNTLTRHSMATLNDVLKEIFSEKKMQSAILIASPVLYFEMISWLNSSPVVPPKKLILTLYKYLLRNGFRCTPYGMFSGCSYGSVSATPGSNINLEKSRYRKMTRLDMGYVMELVKMINNSGYLQQASLFTNPSLYFIGSTYRYCEYKMADGKRHYFLSEIERTPYIDRVVNAAENGIAFDQLAALLTDEDISGEDAIIFITSLVDMQVLESALTPKLTSSDILGTIIGQLNKDTFSDKTVLNDLIAIDRYLKEESDDLSIYKNVRNKLNTLLPAIDHKDVIQTDLVIEADENTLNQKCISAIVKEISDLSCLNQNNTNKNLEEFKKRFFQKYEEQEIPLLMALDTDIGLGYGEISGDLTYYSSFLEDLIYPQKQEPEQTVWTTYQKWLLKKFISSQKNGENIRITPEDLKELNSEKYNQSNIQSNFYAIGNLIADSMEEFDLGNYEFILHYCGGSSAFNLLSRFSTEKDDLFNAIKKYSNIEVQQNKDKIIAEIVHFAGDRIGNILTRPKIYDYEISFLGSTSAEGDFRIPASDLRISVSNNRLVLKSKRLNKEIIPRLTSAHNYTHGLPVYRFLCDLQFQDYNFNLKWDWSFLKNETFLPRVTYGRIILNRAQWRICQSEFTNPDMKPDSELPIALKKLLTHKNIPQEVVMSEGDNELYLDLRCIASREILLNSLKKRDVLLMEYIPSRLLSYADNSYANELIIPIQNRSYAAVESDFLNKNPAKRNYLPGDDWLYLKIYTSNKWMDYLLTNDINSLIQLLNRKKLISGWFFVRYKDTEPHLRIRFKKRIGAKNFEQRVIKLVNDCLSQFLEDRIVYKLQYDTYVQEIEKYGAGEMALTESIFFNDSNAILNLLQEVNGNDPLRWQVALHTMDAIFSDFNFNLVQRYNLVTAIHSHFINEFNVDKNLNKRLNDKFRALKPEIAMALTNPRQLFSPEINHILYDRAERARPIAKQLINKSNQLTKLTSNYIHLFINRIFPANQRLMELTLYHFLKKWYESQLARNIIKS